LFTRGRLAAGESVLVLGAGGGVATMTVSLAAAAGDRVRAFPLSQAAAAHRRLEAGDGFGKIILTLN
jgi:NADPH:quinone reductase-like Zn-dependent oxidoreductase